MFQVVISEPNQGKRIPINKNESCLRAKRGGLQIFGAKKKGGRQDQQKIIEPENAITNARS